MVNLPRYLEPKARYIAELRTADNLELKRRLLNTLIDYAVEKYKLNNYWKKQAVNTVKKVVEPIIGDIDLDTNRRLPDDWKEVIKERKALHSFRQLDKKEIEYHNEYCSKESGCAFKPISNDTVCPVCRFGGN